MDSPTAEAVAHAFDLGRPLTDLVFVRRGATETWRLDTTRGSYFVKGAWDGNGLQFTPGGLPDQLEAAMAFERRALEAGIDMAEPVPPVHPWLGSVARINDRLFRVNPWIDHRPLRPNDDLADWLGRTMAQIHQLEPLNDVGLPDWWRGPLWPRATWEEWIDEAQRLDRSWSSLARDCLPTVLDLSTRIEELCEVAPDPVTTHGDFKTHNLLMTPTGPVLVDWDSVRVDSAALEAGRVAHIFAAGDPAQLNRILTTYTSAGGDLSWPGSDLFISVLRHDLQILSDQILVSLNRNPPAWWMGDGRTIEKNLNQLLIQLPVRADELRRPY
ncbi:aminoglycoside phosphotransferase family protein [Kribbella sp. NPDC051718]|uniref:phosphotransferase enzyme family protein n=1 Tax=Kribbella sp. NPDC051718 TaxID=3155168 RepID=UPI00342C17C4